MSDYANQVAAQNTIPGARYPSMPASGGAEQRFRCIDLAIKAGTVDHNVIKLAGEFYDFVTGKDVADRVADALRKSD